MLIQISVLKLKVLEDDNDDVDFNGNSGKFSLSDTADDDNDYNVEDDD